jgi:ABC-type oligopeptide transport system substrate-binding subunit
MGKKAYMVAIPTSSGTGSEVTPFAIITDGRTGTKWPLADYELMPNMAIVDANNMLSASTPIAFEYLTNNTSGHIAIAECLQQDFAQIGINMTIKSIDWAVFLNERKEGNFGIARNGWIADFNDPINMLEMWTTVSGNNDAQFGR